MSSTLLPPPREQLCNRSCSNKTHIQTKHSTHSPALGGLPDPPMVASGIRSPIGLVVESCTSHPGVLGSIPKREEPGKTGAPCVKVPGSSRVPGLKSKVGLAAAKAAALRVNLNVQGCVIVAPPMHALSRTPLLLPLLLSHNLPTPRVH